MDTLLWPLIIDLVALLALDITASRRNHDSRPGPDANSDWSERTRA